MLTRRPTKMVKFVGSQAIYSHPEGVFHSSNDVIIETYEFTRIAMTDEESVIAFENFLNYIRKDFLETNHISEDSIRKVL